MQQITEKDLKRFTDEASLLRGKYPPEMITTYLKWKEAENLSLIHEELLKIRVLLETRPKS
jgi:hypothetical protein